MPRLSEVAQHVVVPECIVTTGWPAVRRRAAEFGITFDEWQDGAGRVMLGKRDSGKYACGVGGIVMSIPRQVGKTFLVGVIVVALCTIFPNLTVVWTAHRGRTATKTFGTLKAIVQRAAVFRYLAPGNPIRNVNGEQEIKFANGSVIMFGAREAGFGRGFDAVDIVVFDEAQILSEKALDDIIPATNQTRQSAGALIFYMGTPPRPTDPGEAFASRRAKALAGTSTDLFYLEISADRDADPDDELQWRKANPSYPHRTKREAMLRMRDQLGSVESFVREGLGVWDAKSSPRVIDAELWKKLGDTRSRIAPDSPIAYAVDRDPGQTVTTIAVAGFREDGKPHVEVVDQREGDPSWVIPWLEERCENRGRQVRAVIIDVASPAKALTQQLRPGLWILPGSRPIVVTAPRVTEVGDACGQIFDAAHAEYLRHFDQPGLNRAMEHARKRAIGNAGQWAWDRKNADSDITPLVAVTLALWGLTSRTVHRPYRSASRPGAPSGTRRTARRRRGD